jgi:hypothetical protein
MNEPVLIAPPASEPVTLAEVKLQLGFGPVEDSTREAAAILSEKLRPFILAARRECENYCRRVFITQRWLLRCDGFPGGEFRYNGHGYAELLLPKPPFQSIDFFQYVDTAGVVQALQLDTNYGNGSLQYGYQLRRGTLTQPARVLPSWARPWPPARMVPSNVMIQFRCGYGQPITCSMTGGSAVLTVAGVVKFNPDDAPLMAGDTGLRIMVPGAGANGGMLDTFIASVDVSGNATLKDVAVATVANVAGWAGQPVPEEIRNAIKLTIEAYYNQGSDGGELPLAARRQLEYYRNLVA